MQLYLFKGQSELFLVNLWLVISIFSSFSFPNAATFQPEIFVHVPSVHTSVFILASKRETTIWSVFISFPEGNRLLEAACMFFCTFPVWKEVFLYQLHVLFVCLVESI